MTQPIVKSNKKYNYLNDLRTNKVLTDRNLLHDWEKVAANKKYDIISRNELIMKEAYL